MDVEHGLTVDLEIIGEGLLVSRRRGVLCEQRRSEDGCLCVDFHNRESRCAHFGLGGAREDRNVSDEREARRSLMSSSVP
eukprot:11814285-Heterocapsa_arctica.AAC.1